MEIGITLKIGGKDYSIQFKQGDIVVSGGDEFLNAAVHRLCESAAEEYSPAMGGRAAYIANWVSEVAGGEVVSVNEPPAEKGVVY